MPRDKGMQGLGSGFGDKSYAFGKGVGGGSFFEPPKKKKAKAKKKRSTKRR